MNGNKFIGALITALLMAIISWVGFNNNLLSPNLIQLLVYLVFALSISFTLLLRRDPNFKFGDYFQMGFRHFILITLVMAIFTYAFAHFYPELREQSAIAFKALLEKEQNKTPAEIEQDVKLYKEGYATALVSRSIFGYLMAGALVTAISSLLLTLQKK
ncbi:MAG: hypothetical protein RLZ05_27 [Bacteroidota bacterium]|jgi:hypothetical protein